MELSLTRAKALSDALPEMTRFLLLHSLRQRHGTFIQSPHTGGFRDDRSRNGSLDFSCFQAFEQVEQASHRNDDSELPVLESGTQNEEDQGREKKDLPRGQKSETKLQVRSSTGCSAQFHAQAWSSPRRANLVHPEPIVVFSDLDVSTKDGFDDLF